MDKYELIENIYDILFKNTQHKTIDFCEQFPDAEVYRDSAIINLGDYIITVERA